MIVDIYQSNKHHTKFLVVPVGTDVSGQSLSVEDPSFSDVGLFKKSIKLEPGLIGFNAAQAEEDINKKGFHINEVRIVVTSNQ